MFTPITARSSWWRNGREVRREVPAVVAQRARERARPRRRAGTSWLPGTTRTGAGQAVEEGPRGRGTRASRARWVRSPLTATSVGAAAAQVAPAAPPPPADPPGRSGGRRCARCVASAGHHTRRRARADPVAERAARPGRPRRRRRPSGAAGGPRPSAPSAHRPWKSRLWSRRPTSARRARRTKPNRPGVAGQVDPQLAARRAPSRLPRLKSLVS